LLFNFFRQSWIFQQGDCVNRSLIVHTLVVLAIAAILSLSGCAATDNEQPEQNIDSAAMGGPGKGGRRQGPPPMMNTNEQEINQSLPDEAFVACEGRVLGDVVEFTSADGKKIKAVCQKIEDHLVAIKMKIKQLGSIR
jgi:hypothetical protein